MASPPPSIAAKKKDEAPADPPKGDDAIDDSEDLDEDYVDMQKTISGGRQRVIRGGIQEILPFTFSPNVRPLTHSDLESCTVLEAAAFSEEHRADRDKIQYRLLACPELCLGLFCTVVPSKAKDFDVDTLATAKPVETGREDGAVSVLLAHVIATRCNGDLVTDTAMDYPKDFRECRANKTSLGHQEAGRTVALHSLAVHPKLQGCGLGKLLMKAYLQQTKNAALADRVSLICQDYLVNYYVKHGFKHLGPSAAGFGGGGWHDMVSQTACYRPL